MAATLNFPLVFCNNVPLCASTDLPLPFGLPDVHFVDPCCQGIEISLDQLNNLLKPLYPFLQIIGCAIEIMNIVLAIPGALGPPPDIGKIIKLTQQVADFTLNCLNYILSLAPTFPSMYLALCKMIKGICAFVVSLLTCLKSVVTVNLSVTADAFFLKNQTDPLLQEMGICLTDQGNNLNSALLDKLASLLNIFNLLNLVVGIIPPVQAVLQAAGLYPIAPNIPLNAPLTDTSSLDNTIVIVNAIYAALSVFCP